MQHNHNIFCTQKNLFEILSNLEQQTDSVRLVPNQSENSIYNLILVWFNKISLCESSRAGCNIEQFSPCKWIKEAIIVAFNEGSNYHHSMLIFCERTGTTTAYCFQASEKLAYSGWLNWVPPHETPWGPSQIHSTLSYWGV